MGNPKIVSLGDAKTQRERDQYRDLVLGAYDDLEHKDKRELLEKKSEIERASRQRL